MLTHRLKLLLILCFTAVGFLLLSLTTATYIKFVTGAEGYAVEETIHDNLFKIDMEYMYPVYFLIFFPVLLIIESFFINYPFLKFIDFFLFYKVLF
jgi:hypothetical protein